MYRTRTDRIVRWVERGLLTLGTVCLTWVGASSIRAGAYQVEQQARLARLSSSNEPLLRDPGGAAAHATTSAPRSYRASRDSTDWTLRDRDARRRREHAESRGRTPAGYTTPMARRERGAGGASRHVLPATSTPTSRGRNPSRNGTRDISIPVDASCSRRAARALGARPVSSCGSDADYLLSV